MAWLPTQARFAMRTLLTPVFIDQRHAGQPVIVAGEAPFNAVQKAPVDFVDNFQMTGQDPGKQGQRPFFEGFRQQGVIGIAAGLHRNMPGLVPFHPVLIHQQPHQFGHRDGRMGVVELNGPQLMQVFQLATGLAVYVDDVLQRAAKP